MNIDNINPLLTVIFYVLAMFTAMTMPIWGYKLLKQALEGKHKALHCSNKTTLNSHQILASVGTTTAGVFMIQILPLLFSIVNDVGGSYAVNTVYSDHFSGSGMGDYVDSFYGLTTQLSDMLQTAAPMAAVGLGGYNLLNNISRGLPA